MTRVRSGSDALRSLRYRDYRLYFWGQTVSMTGTWLQQTAQSWLVYRLTGSGALLGVTAAAAQAPSLLLGLVGGEAADRWSRRDILLWTQGAALFQAAALALLTSLGLIRVWEVIALAAVLGVINAFEMPARQALVPELVPPGEMGNAIALSSMIINSSRLVGPALAGLIIARSGEAACFWLNSLSFLAVMWSLWLITPRRPARSEDGWTERGALAALRYAWNDLERRAILLLLAAISLTSVPLVLMLMPAYSEGVLKSGPHGLGLLMTCVGAGAVTAAARLARRDDDEGLLMDVGRAVVIFGAATAALAFARTLAWAVLPCAAAGFAMTTSFAGANIRLQARADDSQRGRLMAIFAMTFMAVTPFGSLLAGWASDRVGMPAALVSGGLACAFAGWTFLRLRPGDTFAPRPAS